MKITYWRYLWLMAALTSSLASSLAQAGTGPALDAPFASSNRNPFVQVYGLPSAQSAQLTKTDVINTALHIDIANSFTQSRHGEEAIFIDGETYRANLQLRYGASDKVELGVDIPYIRHEGGSLDGFIDDWHDFWNLPDGGRPGFVRDQLQFHYQQQGSTLKRVTGSEQGMGDASVSMAYQLASSTHRQWALRGAVKLPTGDADNLLGSESTDVSLGVNVSDQSLLQRYRISLHASGGVLLLGSGEVLDQRREDWVVYGSSTLSWQFTSVVNLKLQLDAHTAFYDSALTELGNHAAQLTLGGTVRLDEKWQVDLAVIEDIAVDTAPDVVFHIGVKMGGW